MNEPIVAGVDGSPAALRAVTWAAAEAAREGRRLVLLAVNTWPSYMTANWPGWTEWDEEAGRALCRDVLAESVADAAIRHATCPVLVAR